jgi:flagellar motor switch protein FliM
LDELHLPVDEVLKWKVGDTIMLDARSTSPIMLSCNGVTKLVGVMGRALDYKAVRVTHTITDVNNQKAG